MSELNPKSNRNALIQAACDGALPKKIKKYLTSCRPPPDSDPKKDSGRLPTLAGFCSSLGCGLQAAAELEQEYPLEFDYLCAVLEDEALNSGRSSTIVNAYLKERLGYGDKSDSGAEGEPLQLVFAHDILEDGQ